MPLSSGSDPIREFAASLVEGEHLVHDDDVLAQLLEMGAVAGERLAEIAGLDLDTNVSTCASYLLATMAERNMEGDNQADAVLAAAAPVAQRLLADPELPDDRKLLLMPVLISTGSASPELLASTMRDLQGALDAQTQHAFEHLTDQPPDLASLAHSLHLADLPDEMEPAELSDTLHLAMEALDGNPKAGAALVAITAAVAVRSGEKVASLHDALGAVAETHTPQAAWWLRELAAVLPKCPESTLARALLSRMESKGIIPAYELSMTFVEGFISQADPRGGRMLFLAFADDDGDHYGVGVLFADGLGMQDIQLLPPSDDESVLPAIDDLVTAPCTVELAREFVADALATHANTDTSPPPEFMLVRPYLGAAPIEPCPREPDVSAFPTGEPAQATDHVARSLELLDSELFGDLLFVSDAAYTFVGSVDVWDEDEDELHPDVLAQFVSEVAELEKDSLTSLMAANLETAHLAGIGHDPLIQMAASVLHVLKDGSVPFAEIPYVRGLCATSVVAVDQNIFQGYASQAEADAAGFEDDLEAMDGEFADLFNFDDPEP